MKVRWEQTAFDGLEEPPAPLPGIDKRRKPRGTAKGNAFARAVAAYLGTEVRALCGAKDKGDLVSKIWVHECKCPGRGQPLNLSTAMSEAKKQARNAGVDHYSVIARRTGYPVAEALFVIPLWKAVELGLDPVWERE